MLPSAVTAGHVRAVHAWLSRRLQAPAENAVG